jgi:U3 small nucleolar RNA-associated protein 10
MLSFIYYFFLCVEQEHLFRELVILFRNANGDIQNATREALMRLNVCSLLICILKFFSSLLVDCA